MHIFLLCLLGNPTHDLFLLDDRLPFLRIPLKLSGFLIGDARGAADEDNAGLVAFLDLHEPEDEDVSVAADEALNGQIPELSLRMRGDLVMLGLDQMKDQMRCKAILTLGQTGITFSLQNHFPQALLEHFKTQLLFLRPQKAQACGGSSSSMEALEE